VNVSVPHTVEELRECEEEHNIAGFPGCIGRNDATNILLEKVCILMCQAQLGFKSKSTTTMRTYNFTCIHCWCQIWNMIAGHPDRWNDKTLICFDSFPSNLIDGEFNNKMRRSISLTNWDTCVPLAFTSPYKDPFFAIAKPSINIIVRSLIPFQFSI
jgi:hypothetical protein